jgi:hypothetical protein
VSQRHKDLGLPLLPRTHRLLDDRQTAVELVLAYQPIEDPLRRMSLLPGGFLILFEDLVNDRQKPVQLPLRPGLLQLIPDRLLVLQNPHQRPPG